jgi:alpha-tubulin suppressor-like RCC1 family protein
MSGALAGKTVTALASGISHTIALTQDGLVFTWGANGSGQLGNGTTVDSSVPVAVTFVPPADPTIVAVAAGGSHCLALADDGVLYAWGDNGSGQLGTALPLPDSSVPIEVTVAGSSLATKTVTDIAGGTLHSLALASDGTVHSWGFNGNGRLGDGTTTSSDLPVAVSTAGVLNGKTVAAIVSGGPFSVALDTLGAVYTWGRGQNGELGDGDFGDSNVPVAITTAGTPLAGQVVTQIAGGNVSAYARTAGFTTAWGSASDGRLGNGTITPNIALAETVSDLP